MRNCSLITIYRNQKIEREQLAERIKGNFQASGITISQWARDHNYTPRDVSLVLNSQIKGRYGKGHDIAVALGLKPSIQQAT